MRLKITPWYLSFIMLLTSCSERLDFSQIEDFAWTPVVESSLVFFTLNQRSFFDDVHTLEEQSVVNDVINFSFLQNEWVQERLVKVDFEIQVNNQFDRDFEAILVFLDANNVQTYTIPPLFIPKNDEDFSHTERIDIHENEQFLRATKVQVIIQLLPSTDGTSLDPLVAQTIQFKSAGTFYLN